MLPGAGPPNEKPCAEIDPPADGGAGAAAAVGFAGFAVSHALHLLAVAAFLIEHVGHFHSPA